MLIQAKDDLNCPDRVCLHMNLLLPVSVLLVDVACSSQFGRRAIHLAAEYNHPELVKALLLADADANAVDLVRIAVAAGL